MDLDTVELYRIINDKYDQANKDIFDFKDTLLLVKKEQENLEKKVNTLYKFGKVATLAVIVLSFKLFEK